LKSRIKLLIISQVQFGYHIPNYIYCKYLKEDFEITFICWDFNKPKIYMDGIKVIYVNRKDIFFIRAIRFILAVLNNIKSNDHIIFITYFKFISTILKLIKRKNIFILDIRTGSVEKKQFSRIFYDTLMKLEIKFFKYKTILSKGLSDKMQIKSNVYILPLGSDIISETKKTFDEINLFYVGTFFNRKIEDTIIGFSKFYHTYKDMIKMKYTIIGRSVNDEEQVIKKYIERMGVSHVVDVPGEMPYDNLKKYFDSNNIGVCYIPITDYYDNQPAIKVFEYLLSGMFVIATNTNENSAIINTKNGMLIQDNPESFYQGLVDFYNNRRQFDSDYIRDSSKIYSWNRIVKEFKEYLNLIYYSEDNTRKKVNKIAGICT
jgi:glycosyltransferase involved in cell wall biosynthesis